MRDHSARVSGRGPAMIAPSIELFGMLRAGRELMCPCRGFFYPNYWRSRLKFQAGRLHIDVENNRGGS